MSSSQNHHHTPEKDEIMMEAPDSPPELSQASLANQSFQASSSQQANTSSSRVNGDSNAKVNFGTPGSGWQTKKFTEEYERADSQLLDRGWNQAAFGDPFVRDGRA